MMKPLQIVTMICLACLGTVEHVFADSPSYFRATGGVAVDEDRPLPADLGSEQAFLWKTPLLPGHSSPCVHGNSIFLTTYNKEQKQLATVALNRATGKLRWTRIAPTSEMERVHSVGSPAVSTPACDGFSRIACEGPALTLTKGKAQSKQEMKKALKSLQEGSELRSQAIRPLTN